MTDDFTLLLTVVLPAAAVLIAAWPLAFAPQFRRMMLGFCGTGCVSIAAAVLGLVASGIAGLPSLGSQAMADDQPPGELKAEADASPRAGAKLQGSDPVIDVAPETIEIPPGRPEWVGAEPVLTGKIHRIPVASGPYALDSQARRALDAAIASETNKYIAEQLGSHYAPQLLRYSTQTIKKRFIKPDNTYHDVARYSVGWMHENFALLEFDPEFRQELDRRWTQVRATNRLAQTGLLVGAGLALISSIYGYFRLDHATRGYYTGRLQFMTAAAILTVIGASAWITQWIYWL